MRTVFVPHGNDPYLNVVGAYGTAWFFAYCTGHACPIANDGLYWRIEVNNAHWCHKTPRLMDMLCLPTSQDWANYVADPERGFNQPIACFDALLAVCLTQLKMKLTSVACLSAKVDHTDRFVQVINKLNALLEKTWQPTLDKQSPPALLKQLAVPSYAYEAWVPSRRHAKLKITMPLGPTYSLSGSSAYSDGYQSGKNALTFSEPLLVLFAILGAIVLGLRAQLVGKKGLLFYLRYHQQGIVNPDGSLKEAIPRASLESTEVSLTAAPYMILLKDWLAHSLLPRQDDTVVVVKGQWAKFQPFIQSIEVLDERCLHALRMTDPSGTILKHWVSQLSSYDAHVLETFLYQQKPLPWIIFLRSLTSQYIPKAYSQRFADNFMEELMLNHDSKIPNGVGVRTLGLALNRLRWRNQSLYDEAICKFREAKNIDEFFFAVAETLRECGILKARVRGMVILQQSEFDDLEADIERYGFERVTSIICARSVLASDWKDDAAEQTGLESFEPDDPFV